MNIAKSAHGEVAIRHSIKAAIVGLVLVAAVAPTSVAAEPVTVFGAASLTDALEEAGRVHTDRTSQEIRFSLASSSTLARQIEAGAPAHIYLSANRRWMDYLEQRHLIEPGSRVEPIANRLVLIAPADAEPSPVTVDSGLDLARRLGDSGRLAVGDPDHVPVGIYAAQALRALDLWDEAEPRLARADDVRAALALVERGEAPLGIVYATDARISDGVEVIGTFPADSHDPIAYPFAIVAGAATPEVDGLFAFLKSAEGQAIFERFGFVRH